MTTHSIHTLSRILMETFEIPPGRNFEVFADDSAPGIRGLSVAESLL